jgi:hypothetical protein
VWSVAVENQDAVRFVGRAMPPPPALAYEFAKPRIAQRYHVEIWWADSTGRRNTF